MYGWVIYLKLHNNIKYTFVKKEKYIKNKILKNLLLNMQIEFK